MAYPSRGAWAFRNISRDFTFYPVLTSISIVQEHPEMLANFDCEVEDEAAALFFDNEDRAEVTFRGVGIWRGHLKAFMEDSVGGAELQRKWVLSGQDYTAKLDDAIVRRRTKRKREKAKRRIRWLLSYMRPNIWALDGIDLSGVPDRFVEGYEYWGSTVREGLQHVADELRLFFYIDFDNVFHMFRTETISAPFALDNVTPDYASTFPFRSWTHEEESTDLGNAFLVAPEKPKDARWTRDATSIAAYGRQERFIQDSELGGPIAAENVGARAIAQSADPTEDSSLICWEPGLVAGMTVHVVEGLWGHDFSRIVQAVEMRAVDPHDESGEAYLETTVSLTDRRNVRGRGKGGSVKDAVNKNTRRTPVASPDPYRLTRFDYVATPPAVTDGAAIPGLLLAGSVRLTRTHGETPTTVGPWWQPGVYNTPCSYLGEWYNGHTTRPSWTGCSGLVNAFTGYRQDEVWWKVVVPAHPANIAGISLSVAAGVAGTPAHGPGYGEVMPLEIVAVGLAPGANLRMGTPIGELMAGETKALVIPAGLIPAEGGELYIGARTKWESPTKDEQDAYACGWTWPKMSHAYDLDSAARPYCGYSGEIGVNTPTGLKWLTWDAAAADLGTIDAVTNAPWEGGNTVNDGGTEGSPTWAIDGDALVVEAEEPAGKGIYVVGSREDDDEPSGPWSDASWGVDFDFEVDAHGSEAAAGDRSITLTTTGQGEQFLGRVQLGDASYPEGVYVAGPTEEAFTAQALTTGAKWRARFDSRAGVVRGKIWLASAGEPAQWMAQCAMSETEDDLDRWELYVRVGNGAASSQEAKVSRIRGSMAAASGQRVVKEYVGLASGLDAMFPTAHRYREDSIRAFVNGISVGPLEQFPSEAKYRLDFRPTASSLMRVTYVAD